MRKILPALFLILCAVSAEAGQELSTLVYPSEDELEEAFYRGEIDFIQLVILQELIRSEIDSAALYLLDEIPNLAYFLDIGLFKKSDLSTEQAEPFLDTATIRNPMKGRISHNYSTRLEEDGDSRYRTAGEISLKEELKAAFRLHREYSGVERLVYRRIEFKPHKSAIKRLVLGNYTTRWGLGTILGYRGKILDFSNEIDGESFLFPDYGGLNGFQAQLKKGDIVGELAFSQVRDETHTIRTVGGNFGRTNKNWKPMAIMSVTNLRNRSSKESINDLKYGFNMRSKYAHGYNEFEVSAQAGARNSFGVFITEGEHLFREAEINYALWIYSQNYLDLTGGSKAAGIRTTSAIEEVDFSYSDKRSGQEGGLLKTSVKLTNELDLINSLIYAQKGKDNYNFEFLAAMEKQVNSQVIIRLDHASRIKHRLESGQQIENEFRRSRIEIRYINPSLYIRTYLAYQSKTNEDDYTSFFTNVRHKNARLGELSLWLNLGEFRHSQGEINYWYAFIENRYEILENLKTMVKLTHSYRRGESDAHVSTITMGFDLRI